LEVTQINI